MSQLAEQILREPGVDASRFAREFRGLPLEDRVESACETLVDKPDMVQYLDDLHDKAYEDFYEVISGIRELPGDVILKYFGDDMLMMLAANAAFEKTSQRLKATMEERLGIDAVLFEKARLWEWQKRSNSKGKNVAAQYEALNFVMNGAHEVIDLPAILRRNAKDDVELSDSRIDDYDLLPLVAEERFSAPDGPAKDWYYLQDGATESYGIWLDAPVAMALTYKGRPQALIAIAANGPDELMIHQLQGVRAKRIDRTKNLYSDECIIGRVSARGLAPLRWQELMIDIGEQLASGLGKKSLGIQSGERNKWTKITLSGESEPHVSLERAIEAYDVPAQRGGFERSEKGDWTRSLQSIGKVAVAS